MIAPTQSPILEALKANVVALEERFNADTDNYTVQQTRIANIDAEIAGIHDTYRSQIASLQEQLNNATAGVQISELQQQVAALNEQLVNANARASAAETARDEAQLRLAQLNEQIDRAQAGQV